MHEIALARRWLFSRAELVLGWLVVRHKTVSRRRRGEEAVDGWLESPPPTLRTCGTETARIHHAVIEWPAFGAAITERWSVRGAGMWHGISPPTTAGWLPGPKG